MSYFQSKGLGQDYVLMEIYQKRCHIILIAERCFDGPKLHMFLRSIASFAHLIENIPRCYIYKQKEKTLNFAPVFVFLQIDPGTSRILLKNQG